MRRITLLTPLHGSFCRRRFGCRTFLSDTGNLRPQLPPGMCLDCEWRHALHAHYHQTTGLALRLGRRASIADGETAMSPRNLRRGDAGELTKEISDAVAANDIASLVEFDHAVGQSVR